MKMPLSSRTVTQVRTEITSFDARYKRDWKAWMVVYDTKPLSAPETAAACRSVLSKWQAVRSKTKGRTIRLLRSRAPQGARCFDDLLADAIIPVQHLGGMTIREVRTLGESDRQSLTRLWDVFQDLPTIGHANAVGITKAVKLVTGGRIGPALDSEVRKHLGIREPGPVTAKEWINVLQLVSEDIHTFELANRCQLEDLVEAEWQPVAVPAFIGPLDTLDGAFEHCAQVCPRQ
jgi:hypothetical protein